MSGKPKERTREKDGRGSILPCQPKALRGRWQRIKECGSKAIKVSLVIALALSALGLSTCALGKAAYAADSAHLTVGSKISYGGYATTWMEADGTMAYCGNPSALTPPAGSYAKHMIDAPSGRNQETIADLWFSYGSEGFERSLWPDTWYDGSAMTDSRYAALAHILLSDTFSSNGNYALFGCNEAFKSWCRYNVIGFGTDGSEINPNATGRLICARQGEVPPNFEAFMLYTGAGNQLILSHSYIPYGHIDLVKDSANKAMTDNNPCYSRAGAIYTVYSNSGLTQEAGTITTDAEGYGILEDLMPGSYWVKETKPSPGYALDPEAYKVSVESAETVRVNGDTVPEIPQSDPVGMLVGKVDADTGEPWAQGDATLSGAQFTVRYYKGDFATTEAAEASGAPERTWVFETDSDGFAYLAEEYKHSGDALYYQSNGDASIPLGTVLIQETKAPQGYNLNDGHGGDPKVFCVRITTDGAVGESVYTYNSPKVPDTVKRGDFRLVKEVPVTIYDDVSGDMPQEVKRVLVPGVVFEIYNDSEAAVLSPESGKAVQPGGKVCSITVDENGLATTKDDNADVNGWSKPSHWSGALAYGTYRIHEVIPSDVASNFKAKWDKELLAVDDWKTTIRDEGQYDPPQLVNDHIPQTPLKIVKVDSETGRQIPLPCSFQLKDSEGNLVTWTSRYPEEQTLDTWTANGRGELTLPMLLEEGGYTLCEVEAPYGYVKELEGKVFTVKPEYKGWDDPLVIEFANMSQKATITVAKTDSDTGDAVDESLYIVKAATTIQTPDGTIRAHEGEIVATLTTNEDGRATTPELYLGTYTVYEAKAKDGYALDIVEKTVSLEYAGQDIAVYDHEEAVTNAPTYPSIKKVDALDPEITIPGAKFHVWNDEGTFDEDLTTDADGIISLKYAKHGTYHIQELEAPEGYAIVDLDEEGQARIIDFLVNDQGMVEWDDTGTMAAEWAFELSNMPKTMKTTATDGDSGTHEGQARDELTIVDAIEYTGLIPGKTYTAKGTLMDKATGEAALDDDGNPITSETTFVAEDSCGTVEVPFTFKGASLVGSSLVAFESMECDGAEYMVHADIDDVDQTVNVVDIATQAHDAATGANTGTIGDNVKLIDTVSYTGLTPGCTYKLFAMLMDKATGNAILGDDGLPRVASTEFVPKETDGMTDVEMITDTTDFAGRDIVFFEKLADEQENIIAVHEDIDDEGQTISVPTEDVPGKSYPKTGGWVQDNPIAAWSIAAVVAVAGAVFALSRRFGYCASDEGQPEKPDASERPE